MFITNFGTLLIAPFLMFSSMGGINEDALNNFTSSQAAVDWQSRFDAAIDRDSWWDFTRGGGESDDEAVINAIDPNVGPTGTSVTLEGENFEDGDIVRFGRGAIHDTEVSNNGTRLTFEVPEDIGRYCPPERVCTQIAYEVEPGTYRVRVQSENETSNVVRFEVTESNENNDDGDNNELSIESVSGPTALEVGAEGSWTVNVAGDFDGNLQYSATWGDEGWSPLALFRSNDGMMQASATFTHTYHEEGEYTPEFTVMDEDGNEVAQAAASVTVSDGDNDADVPHIDSVDPSSAEVGATVAIMGDGFDADSRVRLGGQTLTDVTVESDTKITFTVPDRETRMYNLRVIDDDGRSNIVKFEIIETTDVESRVSISGLSAPTVLAVGESGTWTVHVDSNLGGNLTYKAQWGDEGMFARMMGAESNVQSSATFSHTYHATGAYTPKFTVIDEHGNSVSATATVIVEANDENDEDDNDDNDDEDDD